MNFWMRQVELGEVAKKLGVLVRRITPMQFGFPNNDPWWHIPCEPKNEVIRVRSD